ncbi:MAG: FAINT domain-containing protein, partial [Chthoniobacterales bacterium]
MKRILFALALVSLLLPAAPRAEAGANVSIDFFYNNLGDDGNWVDVGDYGYCWQPNVAVSNSHWRPYSDGYWAYTDVGWTWVSYEDFGWATYHYGRWARIRDQGWVWVPGREWGPAWVSWRTGGDHVGWAPLPPRHSGRGGEVVYEGQPITGRVDLEFDIGPEYYNFVDVRYIGDPVLRERIYEPSQNITYINNTVNVTNITYNNSTVYNYGPDYNRLSAYSTRPIRRMELQHETNVDFSAGAPSGGFTRVQGDQLLVAAPMQIQKASAQEFAPKVVKTKIPQTRVETGWMGISDPTVKAEIQQKLKTEDLKVVPPARLQPIHPEDLKKAAVGSGAPPMINAPAAPPPGIGNPADQGKLTREQMMQQNANAKKAAQAQQAEQIRQSAEMKKAERDQQMKQSQETAATRKAQMQQDAEAKKAAQGQQAEQAKQSADAKRAERDQQMKQSQETAATRK